MAIDKITSASITTDAVGPTQLNEASNYAFTGTVTGAGEDNKPIFKVSGGNLSLSHNTWTKLTISSEAIDTGSCFDLAGTKRFVPNVAGKYLVLLSVTAPTSSNADYIAINIYKNGSNHTGANGLNRDYNSVQFSSIVEANGSSDYFEAYAEQESGGNMNLSVNYFSGFYIGN
tara:strand:+ start:70 stop:588 length:519 start_codon:yes stop_codon:yes gene_type:complete